MKKITLLLTVLLFTAVFAEGALIFYDDFEGGDVSGWDAPSFDGGGIMGIDNTVARRGTYSFKAEDPSSSATERESIVKYINVDELYFRFYVYMPSGFLSSMSSGDIRLLSSIVNENGSFYLGFQLYNSGGTLQFRIQETNGWQSRSYSGLLEDTWYCIEIKAPLCVADTVVQWWVNDSEQGSITADFSAFGSWKQAYLGLGWCNNAAMVHSIYFDEVVISDSPIGLLSGGPYNGIIQFTKPYYFVNEDDVSVDIPVIRVGGSDGAVSVSFETSSDTASSGDYTDNSGTLDWTAGDTSTKTITVNITNDGDDEENENLRITLSNSTGGAELCEPVAATLTIVDDGMPYMILPSTIVSRGRQAYSNRDQSNAYRVTDSIYTNNSSQSWTPVTLPAWIAINVGGNYDKLLFIWNAGNNREYRYQSTYAGPADYTIQVSNNSTDGADGTWNTVASVTGNPVRLREHSFNFTGMSWVKLNITGEVGSSWSIDEIDIYDISSCQNDTILFLGDSITARAYQRLSSRQPSYAEKIHEMNSNYFPAMVNAGTGGELGSQQAYVIDDTLSFNPDIKYWCLGYGSNDIKYGWSNNPTFFKKSMQTMIDKIRAAGHTPIVQRIPYSTDPGRSQIPAFNTIVDQMVIDNELITGPDFYDWFLNNTGELGDTVHPNDAGYISMNRIWSETLSWLYSDDTTPPADIAWVNDGTGSDIDTTTTSTELSANWAESTDPDSGISRYVYAIGTTAGGTDVAGWTTNGPVTDVTRTGLSLTIGTKYYFTVKAVNRAGLESNPVNSNGQTVASPPYIQPVNPKVYPNPYIFKSDNSGTMTFSDLPSGSTLKIYTVSGKLIKSYNEADYGIGQVEWDIQNENGEYISPGLYIYTVTHTSGNKLTGKIVIVK